MLFFGRLFSNYFFNPFFPLDRMAQELRIRHRNRRLEAVESIDARDE